MLLFLMTHNTRIAPSPTGDMHLGTARTAYFNYLATKASGGKFTLRIDDTDQARNKQEHVDVIFETMRWLGLDYDHVFYQSQRTNIYNEVANKLVHHGLAKVYDNGAIGLNLNNDIWNSLPTSWRDGIAGDVKISNKDRDVISSLILMKGDGNPAYNFATTVDDATTDITHVIRGHDHISNTAKQFITMHLMNNIGMNISIPKYTHVGLIMNNKKKLSKRDNAASMLKYRADGYSPDALLNFMLRLGWAESDGKTIRKIPKDDAIRLFLTHGKMRNQHSNMDFGLLNALNKRYKN